MKQRGDDTPKRQWSWELARSFLAVGRFLLWLISWAWPPEPCEGAAAV